MIETYKVLHLSSGSDATGGAGGTKPKFFVAHKMTRNNTPNKV